MNELEEINKCTYKNLTSLLFRMVPEYKNEFMQRYGEGYEFESGIYLFMNEFASCLAEEMEENISSVFVSNAFQFINSIGESNNLEVLNVINVGILEILYTTSALDRQRVSTFLSSKLQKYFQSFSKLYY